MPIYINGIEQKEPIQKSETIIPIQEIKQEILFESNYQKEWQNSRVKFIIDKYGKWFFNKLNILELAPFNGAIGNYFHNLGARLTLIEGNKENCDYIRKNYPHLNLIKADLTKKEWDYGYFDIIINFGIFYHLPFNHKEFLDNCLTNCDLMFLETEVFDTDDKEEFYIKIESGPSQSIHGSAEIKSSLWIEDYIKKNGFYFKRFDDKKINAISHTYDWKEENSKCYKGAGNRRFYIIAKNLPKLCE